MGAFALLDFATREYSTALCILVVGTLVLTAAASATMGTLYMAYYLTRSKDIAIRMSLGATRLDTFAFLLSEPLALSIIAAAIGLGVASLLLGTIRHLNLIDIGGIANVGLTAPIALLSVAIAIATGCLAGLIGALAATRRDLISLLRSSAQGISLRDGRGIGMTLIVAQVCLGMVVLTSATLLSASFVLRVRSSWGIVPENVTLTEIALPRSIARLPSVRSTLIEQLITAARRSPDVISAAASTGVPVKWKQWPVSGR